MGIPFLDDPKKGFLVLGIAGILVSGFMAYQAAFNEITGEAVYHKPTGVRRSVPVHITRDSDPATFRKVTNFRWAISVLSLGVAIIGVRLYHKLDDYV